GVRCRVVQLRDPVLRPGLEAPVTPGRDLPRVVRSRGVLPGLDPHRRRHAVRAGQAAVEDDVQDRPVAGCERSRRPLDNRRAAAGQRAQDADRSGARNGTGERKAHRDRTGPPAALPADRVLELGLEADEAGWKRVLVHRSSLGKSTARRRNARETRRRAAAGRIASRSATVLYGSPRTTRGSGGSRSCGGAPARRAAPRPASPGPATTPRY